MAEHFDIRLADMTSRRRPESIAFPRQVAMFLSRQMTESSLSAIGDAFGGRDHGTVLHACRLVKDRMEVDANVRQVVSFLEKQLMRWASRGRGAFRRAGRNLAGSAAGALSCGHDQASH